MQGNVSNVTVCMFRVPIVWCSLIVSIVLNVGCASNSSLYYWGKYEGLVYDMYNKPGSAAPEVQIDKLTRDIHKADSRGIPVPPGVFVHLGVMYAAVGNQNDAMASFNEEKERFPESHVLVNGMMLRAYGESAVNDKQSNNEQTLLGKDHEL